MVPVAKNFKIRVLQIFKRKLSSEEKLFFQSVSYPLEAPWSSVLEVKEGDVEVAAGRERVLFGLFEGLVQGHALAGSLEAYFVGELFTCTGVLSAELDLVVVQDVLENGAVDGHGDLEVRSEVGNRDLAREVQGTVNGTGYGVTRPDDQSRPDDDYEPLDELARLTQPHQVLPQNQAEVAQGYPASFAVQAVVGVEAGESGDLARQRVLGQRGQDQKAFRLDALLARHKATRGFARFQGFARLSHPVLLHLGSL